MKKTTIERAFSLGLLCAEKMHGRGLQAEICRRTTVDSSNLNSIMKKEKGAREATRREIFNAVVEIVPELEGMDYEGFLSMGESIDMTGGDDIDFNQFKRTTTQTTTGNRSPAQQHTGAGNMAMFDRDSITCTGLDERNAPGGTHQVACAISFPIATNSADGCLYPAISILVTSSSATSPPEIGTSGRE